MSRMRRFAASEPPPHDARLSPSLVAIIDFVAANPECGVKEVARGLKLATPTVSINIRQLEEAGFVVRKPHPRDRRAVQLSLTPQGQALHEQTYAFRRQTFERLLAGLTPAERKNMLSLLEKALDQAQ